MRSTGKTQPVLENTPHRGWESFHCEVVRGHGYGAQWHFHPEHQLTLVLKSRGHRVVGDSIAPLTPGDLVLVAGNVPHVWHQDEVAAPKSRDAVHAIVVRFRDDFLGGDFLHKPEMQPVRALLRRANRGLQVTGRTRENVAQQMQKLARAKGLERVIRLLAILGELAQSRELKPLSSAKFLPELQAGDQDRMSRVLGHIHGHLMEDSLAGGCGRPRQPELRGVQPFLQDAHRQDAPAICQRAARGPGLFEAGGVGRQGRRHRAGLRLHEPLRIQPSVSAHRGHDAEGIPPGV